MEKGEKASCSFIFKKRNVKNKSSRKRKGSEEEDRTYIMNFSLDECVMIVCRYQKNECCVLSVRPF